MTKPAARAALPFSNLAPMLRVAFVGESERYAHHTQQCPAGGVMPLFVDFRVGADPTAMLARLAAVDPDVVLVFRPDVVPQGAFAELDALTVGISMEPIVRAHGDARSEIDRQLDGLGKIDSGDFDRIVCCDPRGALIASRVLPVWRSLPLPVADRLFMPSRELRERPRALLTGRVTAHQERFLSAAQHLQELVDVLDDVTENQLIESLQNAEIGLNLHDEPNPGFESRVSLYAAAGLLVVTEPLDPTHGLEPGIDYVEVHDPDELRNLLVDLKRDMPAYRRIRVRGRTKAERFRASRVFPELVADLLRDVAAFGSRGRV